MCIWHYIFESWILKFNAELQVRSLEQQNKILETEIEALKSRYVKPSGLRMMYEEQLRELRRIAEQMQVQRVSTKSEG